MKLINFDEKQGYIGRVPFGADLYEFFMNFVKENKISSGQITAFGSASRATVAFYDQNKSEYIERHFPQQMEILNVIGNISFIEKEPLLHLHILLSDEEGNAYGGQLVKGTEIFSCEFIIKEFNLKEDFPLQKEEVTA